MSETNQIVFKPKIAPNYSVAVLRRQLGELRRHEADVHRLAEAMFSSGTRIEYKVTLASGADRQYFGLVVAVCGIPGTTRLRVRNLQTQKEREISLSQVTGLVKED